MVFMKSKNISPHFGKGVKEGGATLMFLIATPINIGDTLGNFLSNKKIMKLKINVCDIPDQNCGLSKLARNLNLIECH